MTGDRVLRGDDPLPARVQATVVTLGNFDGVHLGHQALLHAARGLAEDLGAEAVALTFDPPPRDVMAPGNGVPHVQTLDDRITELLRYVDRVVVQPFTVQASRQSAEAFATEVLGQRLRAAAAVVGHDFRFGQGRAGDAALLRRVLGIEVVEVDPVTVDGIPVSSTRVRQAVQDGDLGLAAALLGRAPGCSGEVVHGAARGRTLGFPTANLAVRTMLLPPDGVYAVTVAVDGALHRGVANLGTRPTVDAFDRSLEVHLLDFHGDLYGRTLHVGWIRHLRGQVRFPSLEALKAQIDADARAARAVLQDLP